MAKESQQTSGRELLGPAVGDASMLAQTPAKDVRASLQTLWIFVTLNYVYADVVTLFDKSVVTYLSQVSLLAAAVLVETAIAMTLLSRILKYPMNRWANITAGAINTLAVLGSLVVSVPHPYYAFFAVTEIATTIVIIWRAWTWRVTL